MAEFLLFGGKEYYANGGWGDYLGTFGSVADAVDAASKIKSLEWAHVVIDGEMVGWWEFTSGWKGFCRCGHAEWSHSRSDPGPCIESGCECAAVDLQPIPGMIDGA